MNKTALIDTHDGLIDTRKIEPSAAPRSSSASQLPLSPVSPSSSPRPAVRVGASERQVNVDELKKAIEVMESDHIREIEVLLKETGEARRIYSAVSFQNGGPEHHYTVRVYDRFDETSAQSYREFRCNCRGASRGRTCRHVIKTNIVDSEKTRRELSYRFIGEYAAHRRKKSEVKD